MVHFCIFGGQGGTLDSGRKVYLTIFGGSEIRRPPLAGKLAERGHDNNESGARAQCFFFTMFGATNIRWPTLAEEFIALRDALHGHSLTWEKWDRATRSNSGLYQPTSASLTIFGGFDPDELPSEDDELEALSLHRHNGSIPENAIEQLMLAIGQTGAPRLAAVRQAVVLSINADG